MKHVMKATTLLREQHGRLDRLLDHIGQNHQSRVDLVRELVEQLLTHVSIEDHFLSVVADRARIRIDRYRDEHARMRNAVLQTVFAETDDDTFTERLRDLSAVVRQHVSGLERDVLPIGESHLRAEELERVGDRMQASWRRALGDAEARS